MVQGATAECWGAEHRTRSNGCTLCCLQILTNSAAVNHPFHGAGAASAAMDPAEGAGCRCRVPRCRETMDPAEGAECFCWMLQRRICVQRKISCVIRLSLSWNTIHFFWAQISQIPLHLQTVDLEPQRFALFISYMRSSCSLSRCHSWQ